MAFDYRRITVNPAAQKSGLLNFRECGEEFFFSSENGKGSIDDPKRKIFRLTIEGIENPVHSSMATDSQGRLRWVFSDCSWVKEFLRANKLETDSQVFVLRTGPDQYRLTPLWKPFSFIDLFAGIGGINLGFQAVGGSCVFSSEFNELSCDTYEANFGHRPFGDITKIDADCIPDHDILLAGFPCQAFSIIGNRKGFSDTRGTLFFDIQRILEAKRPTAFLLENVKQFKTHNGGETYNTVIKCLHDLGYITYTAILNALNYGVPQKRERTFIVGFQKQYDFSFPAPFEYRPHLDEVLEPDTMVDPKLIATEYIQKKRLERLKQQGREAFYPSIWHENKGGHIGMHPFSCALRANASHNYLLVNGKRRMTSREYLRFQGFPESFKIVVPNRAIRAQAGNAVAVPVITAIASRMMTALHKMKVVREYLFDDSSISQAV